VSVPLDLEKEINVLDFPLPERGEIKDLVQRFLGRIGGGKVVTVESTPELIESLVDASLGLTLQEIENVLSRAIIDDLRIDRADVEKILRQKQFIVRKSGILEYYDTRRLSVDLIGGLEALKEWLATRAAAFSEAGQKHGIAAPKGVLVTGVPGCGKSLSAKCTAAAWRLPLVRLDLGKVYSRWIGSSEEHIRAAIATCESVAPCVLWIDEIEKGLPRATGPVGDTGVSLRVLGTFLTWLQEKTAPVFVFATANEIDLLPPEILRKGRFDEVFFVDLPTDEERRDIIAIQLRKIRRDPRNFDLDELVKLSGEESFGEGVVLSGAEIESWVNESLIHQFYHRNGSGKGNADLAMDDLRAVIRRIVPLARLRQGDIETMRTWANTHALSASRVPASREGVVIGGRQLDL
jgi:SpoVK/Ycf46/Vps4 family AAA+-type ATPase